MWTEAWKWIVCRWARQHHPDPSRFRRGRGCGPGTGVGVAGGTIGRLARRSLGSGMVGGRTGSSLAQGVVVAGTVGQGLRLGLTTGLGLDC
jgi:hypothetical protein